METDSSPYVAAIICHYVGMFAALYYDDFLLDDRKIILCGARQRDRINFMSTGVVRG